MNLVPIDSEFLWRPAAPLTPEDIKMHHLTFKEMQEMLPALHGVALAFPQVGIDGQAFVTSYGDFRVVINPTWKQHGTDFVSKLEGCLSRPGWHTFIRRPLEIDARWTDEHGAEKASRLFGMEARVFQHEADHLNGVCVFPRPVIHAHG